MSGAIIYYNGQEIEVNFPCYRRAIDGSVYVRVIDLFSCEIVGYSEDLAVFHKIYGEETASWFDKYRYEESTFEEFDQGVSAALGQCINIAAQLSNPH